ncbi:MAG: hypothetical protein AUJ85_10880 [Elusimicrobia bacterium CG1_02_37_114]|nr:MAG: hypothetical protein AUJ85_10880 [Elusimicrobia bacterium CG1_02_37_114]
MTEQFSIAGELICKNVQLSTFNFQQVTYHLNDHLGSAVFILDSAGNLLANHYHDPFGKAWNVRGDIGNNVRFTGKEYEEDIGLYYFAMRWYDPEVGRFVSQDPLEPMGYVYVANNPMRYVDPSGLEFVWWNPFTWFGGGDNNKDSDKGKDASGDKGLGQDTKGSDGKSSTKPSTSPQVPPAPEGASVTDYTFIGTKLEQCEIYEYRYKERMKNGETPPSPLIPLLPLLPTDSPPLLPKYRIKF